MIYLAKTVGNPAYLKIGYTRSMETLATRIDSLQVGCPLEIELAAVILGEVDLERALHTRFAAHLMPRRREWFRWTDELADFASDARSGMPFDEFCSKWQIEGHEASNREVVEMLVQLISEQLKTD